MRVRSYGLASLVFLIVAACSGGASTSGGFASGNASGASGSSGGASGSSAGSNTGASGATGAQASGGTGAAGTATGATGGATGSATTGTSGGATGSSSGTPTDDWLTTPTPGDATANFPFPQNRKSARCTYPTTISNANVQKSYQQWQNGLLVPATVGTRVKDPLNSPANLTTSEGMAYGMIITAYMGDKTLFDALWAYAQKHFNGDGLMSWKIDASTAGVAIDPNSATDADEDMAWALLMADKQWGGPYLGQAKTMIGAIRSKEVDGTGLLKAGDYAGGANNPDYAAPNYYANFAAVTSDTSWTSQVMTAEFDNLNRLQNNGLIPDTAGAQQFGYNAIRAPWRLGMDYCWHGTAQSQTFLGKMNNFFVTYAAQHTSGPSAGQFGALYGGVDALKLPFQLNGTAGSDPAGTLNGVAAVGAMVSASNQAFIDNSYKYLVRVILPGTTGKTAIGPNYFSATLGMIGLIALTGNFVDYRNP